MSNATEAPERLQDEVSAMQVRANALVIKNDDDVQRAGSELQLFKGLKTKIKDTFDPLIASAKKNLDAVKAAKAEHWIPVVEAEKLYRDKSRIYLEAQAEKARVERERLERIERVKEEKRRAEEQKRLKVESDKRAAEARKAAKAAATKRDAERLRAEAARIKREAAEAAELARQTPLIVEEVKVSEPVKVKGLSIARRWKYRIVDPKKITREYMKIDEVKIGQIVRAMKENTNIPGVEAYPETSTTVR